jgi:hypothetical protein
MHSTLNTTIDGGSGSSIHDYCGGNGETQNKRRAKMACIVLVLTAKSLIEQHVLSGTFPIGLLRSVLVQSVSFVKDHCNFQDDQNFFVIDEEGRPVVHDEENVVIDGITSQLVGQNIEEQIIIVDAESIENLKREL